MPRKILLGLCLIGLVSCGPKLTTDNVAKIHQGMSPAEVESILGKPTASDSGSLVIATGTTYDYKEGDSEVKITFLNDKVIGIESHIAQK